MKELTEMRVRNLRHGFEKKETFYDILKVFLRHKILDSFWKIGWDKESLFNDH